MLLLKHGFCLEPYQLLCQFLRFASHDDVSDLSVDLSSRYHHFPYSLPNASTSYVPSVASHSFLSDGDAPDM